MSITDRAPSIMEWMAKQMAAIQPSDDTRMVVVEYMAQINPRPRGSICKGSATDDVLRFLRDLDTTTHGAWVRRSDIVAAVRRSERSVDGALAFLRREGIVSCVADTHRRIDGLWRLYRVRPDSGGDNL
jgi:hypothetical protein